MESKTNWKLDDVVMPEDMNRIEDGISTLNIGLNVETTARQNADATLQANITNEATVRANADALKANIAGPNLTGRPTVLSNMIYHEGNITVSQSPPTTTLPNGCMHNVY